MADQTIALRLLTPVLLSLIGFAAPSTAVADERSNPVAVADSVDQSPQSGGTRFVVSLGQDDGQLVGTADEACSWEDLPPGEPLHCFGSKPEGERRSLLVGQTGLLAAQARYVYEYSTMDIEAVAGLDYEAGSGTFTVEVGEYNSDVTFFRTYDDSIDEFDERFVVHVEQIEGPEDPAGYVIMTISDNDDPPTLSIADAKGPESAGSLAFVVTLRAASGKPITVDYATSDGTATAGADYGSTPGELEISPGETTATISVPIVADILDEDDEDFQITLSNPQHVTVEDGSATGTIEDDDDASTSILLAAVPASVGEDAGATAVTVTATLNASARKVATTVTVSVAGSGAEGAVDFAAVQDFDIQIEAEKISGSASFTLTPEDDYYDEANETVTVSGTSDLEVESTTVTLVDDDETPKRVTLSASPTRVSEGDGATTVEVTASMVGARSAATTVTASVAGSGNAGAVDFASVSDFDIAIPAGTITATGSFTLTPEDDHYDETDETVSVSGTSDLEVEPTTVTLVDDDSTPMEISLSVSPTRVSEGDGATTVEVTAAMVGALSGATIVTVSVGGSDDAGAVDFAPVGDFGIEIAAGAITATGSFTLTPEDDVYGETDETVVVRGASDLPVKSATMVLLDDDDSPTRITLAVAPVRVSEGAGATDFTVTAAFDRGLRPVGTTITVSADWSGNFDAVDFSEVRDFEIEIPADATIGSGTFTLRPANDSLPEDDETVTISGTADLPVMSTALVIEDDDESSNKVSLTAAPSRVSEGGGATTVTVTATLDVARNVATAVTVSVNGSGNADAVDFAAVSGFEIGIEAGKTSASGSFTLTPEDDAVDESDETVTVSGLSDLSVESAEVTLADDDATPRRISLSAAPMRVSEGGGAVGVKVTAAFDRGFRSAATTVTVSVSGSGAAGAVDFAAVPDFEITIAANAASGSSSFPLTPEDDFVDESDETLTVSGTADLPVDSTRLTLADDDEAPRRVSLSAVPARVPENGGATAVTVTAAFDRGARPTATTVSVSVSGSGDAGAVDFAAVSNFEIEIGAGATSASGSFTLTPEDDAFDETDETLTVSGTADLPVESAQLTLSDDDEAPRRVSLSAVPARVPEGGGAAAVTVTAAFDRSARPTATTVTVSVSGSGDAGAVDFAAVSNFDIEIGAGATSASGSFTLTPEDDVVDETDETLTVSGASDLPVDSTRLTLADDDEAPRRVSLSAVPARIPEGGGAAAVTVTAAFDRGARPTATTVTVSVSGSGAAGAVDFAAVSDFDIEIGAGATSASGSFTLTPEDDVVDETDETLTVSGASDLPVDSARLTLADDDEAPRRVSLSAVPARVPEGGGAAAVTVTAAFDRGARPTATTVSVSVSGSGAADAVDFAAVSDFDIEIGAGATSASGSFTLTPEDDVVDEADETLTVSGTSDLPVDSTRLTLADDDEAPRRVSLSAVPARIPEGGGAAAVTVTAAFDRGARPTATTVTVSVSGSGAAGAVDFAAVSDFDIEIGAGATSASGSFTLTPEDDVVDESDETLTVSGTSDLPVDSTRLTLVDDDVTSTRVSLAAVPSLVSEGAGATTVTVTANLDGGAREVSTTASVSVSGSGAAGVVGFSPVSDFQIEIPAATRSGSGTFVLEPEDDNVAESSETLTVSGTSDLPVESAGVTLTDDDAASSRIVLSVAPAVVGEDAGATAVTVTAALNGSARATATTVTVSVSGSGTDGAVDFAAVAAYEIEIMAGRTSGSGTFRLTPENDAFDEADETVTVSGTSDLPVDPAELTLADDDDAPTRILLSAFPGRISEGDGEAGVTVTAAFDRGARPSATTVTVSVAGSGAAEAVDFAPVTDFEIEIGAGAVSASGTFSLTPEDDAFDEVDETVTVSGTSDLPVDPAELTLADDDAAPTRILLSAFPGRISEGDGEAGVTVTAAFDRGARPSATTVTVSVAGSGAAEAVDFAPVTDFEIEIGAGAASASATFRLTPDDDAFDEADETVTVSGTSDLPVDPAELTLADDDDAPTRILLSAFPGRISEGDGETAVTVTAAFDRGARPAATTVTVSVVGSGAAEAVDFAPVTDFEITIPANAASGSAAFTLTPEDDTFDEADETATVSGASDLPVESVEVVLADDDAAPTRILLSASPGRISEGGGEAGVTVTAAFDRGVRPTATTVTVAVSGSVDAGAVDFSPVPDFEITIPANAANGSAAFMLTPEDDALDEVDETVTVSGASDLPVESAELTLADDDQAPTRISLSAFPARVSEGGGATEVTVTAAFDRGARPSATPVTVSVAGSGAVDAADFAPVPDFEIEIPANAAGGAGTFILTPEDDGEVESDERLTVSGASVLPVSPAELTLADDDEVSTRILLFLAVDPARASEGDGEIRVTVTASVDKGVRPDDTRIAVTVAGSGDPHAVDFDAVSDFDVVIPANVPSGTGTFAVVPENDRIAEEDELLTVSGVSDLRVTPATMVLLDDDEASEGVVLSVVPVRVSEGDGRVAVTVTASLDRDPRQEATAVTVSVSGSGDPDAADFVAVPDFGIEIAAGGRSGSAVFTLTPEEDNVAEADETLTLSGRSDLPVVPAEIVLADDDEASSGVLLSASPASVSEGDGATVVTVTATLNGSARVSATPVTVTVSGSGNPEAVDFTQVPAFGIEIPAGGTSMSGSFTLMPEDDEVDEVDESLAVTGDADLPVAAASVTLVDDDRMATALSVEDAGGSEASGALLFRVVLDHPAGRRATVRYATRDAGGRATAGTDYLPASGTLSFEPGDTEATIRVVVLDDAFDEPDETFGLALSEPTGAVLADGVATGTIRDDDESPALSVRDAAGRENIGELAFIVSLVPASGHRVEVHYATADRTASAGSDYAPASGRLTFEPGAVEAVVHVAVLDDALDEPDETFGVALADAREATLERGTATGTILDDDLSPPTVAVVLPDATLCVGGASYEVRLSDHFGGETLSFAASTSSPGVAAAALSDGLLTVRPVAEGDATVTVTTANPVGESVSTFAVRVVSDPAELEALDSVLASIGRGLLDDATSAVDARFQVAGRPSPVVGNEGSAVRREGLGALASLGVAGADRGFRAGSHPFEPGLDKPSGGYRAPFSFSLSGVGTEPSWSVWGRGGTRRFESGRGGTGHDGSQTAFQFGVDGWAGDWLGGVSLSVGRASADYRFARSEDACGGSGSGSGMLAAEFATVQPYAGRRTGSGWFWATVGTGRGEADVERCGSGVRNAADLSVHLAAAGGRHAFERGRRFVLSLVQDVGLLRLQTGAGKGPVGDRRVSLGRVRIGLEASGATPPNCPVSLTTFVKLLARKDWGDGDPGAGLELAAGGRLRDRTRRLAVSAEVHALGAHSGDSRRETGANIAVSLLPKADGTGLRVVLSSRRGVPHGSLDRWADNSAWLNVPHRGAAHALRWSGNARLGYGFAARRGLAEPFLEFGGRASARLGVRYVLASGSRGLRLECMVGRGRHPVGDRIGLSVEARF